MVGKNRPFTAVKFKGGATGTVLGFNEDACVFEDAKGDLSDGVDDGGNGKNVAYMHLIGALQSMIARRSSQVAARRSLLVFDSLVFCQRHTIQSHVDDG